MTHNHLRRYLALLLCCLASSLACSLACSLGGCVAATVAPLTVGFGADVAIFHRSIADSVYSAVTGKDCSVVRLDRGETWCKPVAPPVPPTPYCTRTLGSVTCWADPAATPTMPTEIAQGPRALTPTQNQARLARWPADLQ